KLLNLNHCGTDVQSLEIAPEILNFGLDDQLGSSRLLLPFANVGLDHRVEIVDVEQEDVFQPGNGRVYVSRNRDIDQQQRPFSPRFQGALGLGHSDDEVRSSCRAEDYVNRRQDVV